MDYWSKISVPKEELGSIHVRQPKLMTPEKKHALLRRMLGLPTANFVGKRNRTKIAVLIYLFNTRETFLSAAQISEETGTSYGYIRNRLLLWFRWGYLKSYLEKTKFDRARKYVISRKGIRYLEKVPPQITREIMAVLENYRTMADSVKRILKD